MSVALAVPILGTVGLCVLIWYMISRFWRPKGGRLPPGPVGLPVIGVAPFLGSCPQVTLTKWAKTYGSVYSMYLGPQLVVVLNDYKAVKTAYVDQADICLGRPSMFAFNYMAGGGHGLVISEGQSWRSQRSLIDNAHQTLGRSNSHFEQLVLQECIELVRSLIEHGSATPFSLRRELVVSGVNLGNILMFGERLARDDERLNKLVENSRTLPQIIAQAGIFEICPLLRYVPPFSSTWTAFTSEEGEIRKYTAEQVERAVRQYNATNGKPKCDVDFMLQARADKFGADTEAAERDPVHSMANIMNNAEMLFMPPAIPIPRGLDWTVLMLLNHPEVQAKCFQEISDNIGTSRQIVSTDRAALPYCEAVLLETMRCVNMTPSAVPHATMADTHLNGYFIPARTMLMQNLWCARWNENDWPSPKTFQPERFLTDKDGRTVVNEKMVDFALLFLTGPRACPGQPITRMAMFLLFTSMIQRIEFLAPLTGGVGALPSTEEFEDGIETQPLPYKVCARDRGQASV